MKFNSICLLILLFLPFFGGAQNSVIDSLEKIIKTGNRNEEVNRALNALATEYTRKDMGLAKNYLYESAQLARELKNPILLSYAYSQMVTVQVNSGNPDSAAYFLTLLKTLVKDDVPENAKANYNLAAGLYYKKMGNYKEALPYMINSLNQYIAFDKKKSTAGSRTSIAGQNLNIGNNLMEMGNYKKALQYHLAGLRIFEEVDNKRGIALCYEGICDDFIRLNQFNEALPYAQKSMALKSSLNDKRGIATTQAEYGSIYKGLQDYDRSVAYFNEATKTFREMKLTLEEAKANLELGKVYALKNNNPLAIKYFELTKDQAVQLKDSSLLLTADASIVSLKNSAAAKEKSEQKLMANLNNAVQMGDKSKELSSYASLADYYSTNKQFDKALSYTRKLYDSTNTLQNQDVRFQVKKMEEQYNLEKKENEIALLKKDQLLNKEKITRQRNTLYGMIIISIMLLAIGVLLVNRYLYIQKTKRVIEMEKMRNKISSDLHDDIGSTLSSINIMSNTLMEPTHQLDEPTRVSLQKIKDYSATIMGNMSDIVWAVNPRNDTMDKMIIRIKSFTAEVLEPKNINYSFLEEEDFTGLSLDINARKDFYLFCKEAINNIAKYSDCHSVKIILQKKGNHLCLGVEDDGKGFDLNASYEGNGLRNMKARAMAMHAELDIRSAPGSGTKISLEVPLT